MIKEVSKAVNKFYHDLAISELQLQNALRSGDKLTYNDILYLDIISAHSGEYTSTAIADMLHVSRPSVTKKVNELAEKGYITRKQSESDKRVYYLFINEDAYFDFCENSLESIISKKLTEQFSEQELEILCKALSAIGDYMLAHHKN